MPTARSSRRCSRPSLATPRRPEKQGICSVPPQIKSSRSPNKGNAISTKTAQKTVWLRPRRVQTRRMQPTQRTRRIFDGGDAEHRMLVRVALRSPSALANRDHPTRRMLPTPDRIWSVHGHVRSAGRRRGVCRPRSTCCTCSAVHVLYPMAAIPDLVPTLACGCLILWVSGGFGSC